MSPELREGGVLISPILLGPGSGKQKGACGQAECSASREHGSPQWSSHSLSHKHLLQAYLDGQGRVSQAQDTLLQVDFSTCTSREPLWLSCFPLC